MKAMFSPRPCWGRRISCAAFAEKLHAIGVTEIACLVDFGVPADEVLASLPALNQLKDRFARRLPTPAHEPTDAQRRIPLTAARSSCC